MASNSKTSFLITAILILLVGTLYYPKWEKGGTEATISWDVSGYYWYLPTLFIYKDLKQQKFNDSIIAKYHPLENSYQSAKNPKSGNYVMKYSCGQALMYSPFFFCAHALAPTLGYPADGFSKPYQFALGFGSILIGLIGLWYMRKNLLLLFDDKTVAYTIPLIALGTNYLNYTAIDGCMTHNWLFTLYSILIWQTNQYYKHPSNIRALAIGCLAGIAALTRPTEILLVIIPMLWGATTKIQLSERWIFWKKHLIHLLIAGIATASIGSIQLFYWHHVTGDWVVYTYEESFSWLHPHLFDCFLSAKAGWLIYTPLMLFSLIGFYWLYKNHQKHFLPIALFMFIYTYIAFAWDTWWYGGSLGQRSMIQAYMLLSYPLASFIHWAIAQNFRKYVFIATSMLFVYYNGWLTHQAHLGGLLHPGEMTKAYLLKVIGRYSTEPNSIKLLDTPEEFTGVRQNIKTIFAPDFNKAKDSATLRLYSCNQESKATHFLCMGDKTEFGPLLEADFQPSMTAKWARASALLRCDHREGDVWKMHQMTIVFKNNGEEVKRRSVRIERLLNEGEAQTIFIDAKLPKKPFNKIQLVFWNPGTQHNLMFDDIKIETFN
jgi:hypothetical protein